MARDEREDREKDLLRNLAHRYRDSAENLRQMARRIDRANRLHEQSRQRLQQSQAGLQEHLGDATAVPFTYLEYIEFRNADEFRKFRAMDVITAEEIESVDWQQLSHELLSA